MSYIHQFVFGIYPYIALSVFLFGSLMRFEREQYSWKTSSSQLLEKKELRRGSIPFHIGILAILGGHAVGLLTPAEVWHVLGISAAFKQMIAMGVGGFFGLAFGGGLGGALLLDRFAVDPPHPTKGLLFQQPMVVEQGLAKTAAHALVKLASELDGASIGIQEAVEGGLER